MKKIITIATLTALALALMMTGALAADADVPEHEHYATCQNPGVCAVCGLEDASLVKEHDIKLIPASDNTHWYYCIVCDTAQSEEEAHVSITYTYTNDQVHEMKCAVCGSWHYSHRTDCLHPGKCIDCGGAYEVEVKHTYNSSAYTTDDVGHWKVCALCNQKQNYETHTWEDKCDTTNHWKQCTVCGIKSDIASHSYEQGNYGSEKYGHWLICDVCGNPDLLRIRNHESTGAWLHNETEHYHTCSVCGVNYGNKAHEVRCVNPGVCYTCGRASSQEAQHELYWIECDETYHAQYCFYCGEYISEKEPHEGVTYTSSDIKNHTVKCSVCGSWSAKHRYTDDTSNICLDCGFDRSSYPHEHVYAKEEYGFDGTNHWLICDTCGKASTEVTAHSGDVQYNGTEHWYQCSTCNQKYSAGAHTYEQGKYATDEHFHDPICDVCQYINYKNTGSHTSTGAWLHNETEHYRTCTVCGVNYDNKAHVVRCTNPGVCYTCGGATTLEAKHNMQYVNHNNIYHRYKCVYCDEMTSELELCTLSNYISVDIKQHKARCEICGSYAYLNHRYDDANPDICLDCGFDSSANPHEHVYANQEYGSDGTNHWLICDTCGKASTEVTAHSGEAQYNGTEHWYWCNVCHESYGTVAHTYEQQRYSYDNYSHWLSCDACEYEYMNGSYEDHTSTGAWKSDITGHWYLCNTCGQKYQFAEHNVKCNLPGLCYDCGYADASLKAEHDARYRWTGAKYHQSKCSLCNEVLSEKEPHVIISYKSETVTEHSATCEVCGTFWEYHRYDVNNPTTCLDCGFEKPGLDDSHTHSYTYGWYGTDGDNHWQICDICALPNSQSIAAHEWYVQENGATTATCTQPGKIEYFCLCGLRRIEDGEALGHRWKETDRSAPTCTQDGHTTGKCAVCGVELDKTILPATGHAYDEGVVTKEPTCTAEGEKTFTCQNANCPEKTKVEKVPAKGHEEETLPGKAASCTEAGLTDGKKCAVCGEELLAQQEIPAKGHVPGKWVTVKAATKEAEGLKEKRCTVCNELLDSEVIPVKTIEYYPNNTACSIGPRFRDLENPVTDKWYMFSVVDLSKEGTQTFDLIASNVYKIGTVDVTVAGGEVTVTYELISDEIQVTQEFMTLIPALADVTSVDQAAFTAYAFGEGISIADVQGENNTALLYICNVVNYHTEVKGLSLMISPAPYQRLVSSMMELAE